MSPGPETNAHPNGQSAAGGRPAFAIFEGGGAKGIAHLGAALGAQKAGIDFIGLAGASAGAFVAALLAAGYGPDELFDPRNPQSNLLARFDMTPIDLLGEIEWAHFTRLRAHGAAFAWIAAWFGLAMTWCLGSTNRQIIGTARKVAANKGHFDARRICDFVNTAIRSKLLDYHVEEGCDTNAVPERVRFRDLDCKRFVRMRPLRIVATDLVTRSARLFSQEETPDAEVGEVVAASIAIPIVFRPVAVGSEPGSLFADGGLVSNLPAWVFAEEKLAWERRFPNEPRVPIVAFTLTDPPRPSGMPPLFASPFLDFLGVTARSAIFGGQLLARRLVEDLVVIPIEVALDTLGFDATWREVSEAVESGRRAATLALVRTLRLYPERVRAELQKKVIDLRAVITGARASRGVPSLGRLRMAIIVPFGERSLRVLLSWGMETEADDRLILAREGPGAATAFRERDVFAVEVGRDANGDLVFAGSSAPLMTRYEKALCWRELKSLIAVPMFPDSSVWGMSPAQRRGLPDPLGVLVVDSDDGLLDDSQDPSVRSHLIVISLQLVALLNGAER